MPTINGSPTNFNLTSTWTVAYNGSYYYIGSSPNTDTQSVTFNFSSIPAGTKIESAVLYATFGSPATGAALRTVDGTSFSGSRNVTITPGGSNTFTFRFKANGAASYPTGVKSSTLSVTNVRIVVNEGQTGGGGDPSNPSGTYQSPQYVWFDDTSDAKPGESRTLKWTAGSAHAGRSVKGYDIHRGTTSGGVSYYKTVGNILKTSVPSRSTNDSSYYYRVLTIQDDNTYYMYSNAVGIIKTSWTDTTPPSSLKPNPQFPTPGQTFTLSWDAGDSGRNNALKGYKIERAESAGGPWTVIANNLSTRTHNTTAPAEHDGKYYYRGTSIGTYSNGDPSALLEVVSVAPSTTGSLNLSTVPMDDVSEISLALNSPNPTYGHVVTWSIGTKSIVDELIPEVAASTIIVPTEWCEETPNSTSGVATVLLETFDGETKVGEASYTFQVTVPSSVIPSILSLDRTVVDGYTGLYLRGISSAQLSVTASGTLESTIPSGGYSLFGAGNSGVTNPWTTPAFNTVGDNNVTAIVVDSRGRSATKTETVHVVDYSWPNISAVSVQRCLIDGTLNDDGTYVKIKATLAVTSLSGNNPIASSVVEYKKRGDGTWVLATSLFPSGTETVVGGGNLLASDAYEIRISLTDTVGKTSTYTTIVSPSTRLYDFRTDRAGVGRIAGTAANQFLLPTNWTTNINAEKLNNYTQGNTSGSIPLNNDVLNVDLDADKLDGYHAGNTTASVPISNGTINVDLNADKIDGVHLSDIRLGQNILHNCDFRNPVNQRGVSGAISTGTYFFDRWIRNSGTVTVNAGYLTVASGAVIEQRIEGNLLAGAVVTASVEVGDTIFHGTGAFPASNGTSNIEVDGFADITLGCATGYMFVLIPTSAEANVKRFKCEIGFVSTLHLDPPMDHATEFPKCQRFALSVKGRFSGGQNATFAHLFVPTPVEMRIVPTYIGTDSVNYYAGSGSTVYTASSITISEKSASGILVSMTAETSLSRVPITNTTVSFEFFASSDL